MINKPKSLFDTDIAENAGLEDVRNIWDADTAKEMARHLKDKNYAVSFDSQSGSPGYIGDLLVLFGDIPDHPVTLVRDRSGRIVIHR